ncbi:MAG: MFS transporter, partial [Proteobacteria bacterium]|nr:MFS transporter [Pseudomonadota bacterium]
VQLLAQVGDLRVLVAPRRFRDRQRLGDRGELRAELVHLLVQERDLRLGRIRELALLVQQRGDRLTPLFLGYTRGFSAYQIGTAIFSTGVASLIGTPVYILLARRFDTRWLMAAGLACFAAAMGSYSLITSDWGGAELLWPQLLRGFPQVFAVAPSVTLGLGSLPPERLKYASGLFNMMRNLGGAVGIAVAAAIINDRTNLHFDHIASRMTEASGPTARLLASVAARYGALPGAIDDGRRAALDQLWHLAYREASTLAFADAFRAIMVAFVVATLLVPLLRKPGAPVPASAAH